MWAANSSEERNAAAWNVQGLVLRLQSGIVRIGDEILLEQLRAHLKMITDIQAGRTNDFHTLAEHTLQMHIRIGALLQET